MIQEGLAEQAISFLTKFTHFSEIFIRNLDLNYLLAKAHFSQKGKAGQVIV